jgi:hypothetical protein
MLFHEKLFLGKSYQRGVGLETMLPLDIQVSRCVRPPSSHPRARSTAPMPPSGPPAPRRTVVPAISALLDSCQPTSAAQAASLPPTKLQASGHLGHERVQAVPLNRIPVSYPRRQSASCRSSSPQPAGMPGHERPPAIPLDRNAVAKRASGPPLRAGVPAYPCSTGMHATGAQGPPTGAL